MIENQEYIKLNDSIIQHTISGACFELNNGNLKGFLSDLDDFFNLLYTYPGEIEKQTFFIKNLIKNIRSKHYVDNFNQFLYQLNNKLSEFYYFSNNIKKAIEYILLGIRSIYNKNNGNNSNLQVLIDVLKLKIFMLLLNEFNSENSIKNEIETIFIEILNNIEKKKKSIHINDYKLKKDSFPIIKNNLMEFSMIISLINEKIDQDFLYKRIEDIIINLKYYKFDTHVFGKILGDLLKIK